MAEESKRERANTSMARAAAIARKLMREKVKQKREKERNLRKKIEAREKIGEDDII